MGANLQPSPVARAWLILDLHPPSCLPAYVPRSTSNLQQSFPLHFSSIFVVFVIVGENQRSCPSTSAATSSLPASTRLPPRLAPLRPTRSPTA